MPMTVFIFIKRRYVVLFVYTTFVEIDSVAPWETPIEILCLLIDTITANFKRMVVHHAHKTLQGMQ